MDLDTCDGSGWLTEVDFTGVTVRPCVLCNPRALRYPPNFAEVPPEIKDQVFDAIACIRELEEIAPPADDEITQPTEWDSRPAGSPWPIAIGLLFVLFLCVVGAMWMGGAFS